MHINLKSVYYIDVASTCYWKYCPSMHAGFFHSMWSWIGATVYTRLSHIPQLRNLAVSQEMLHARFVDFPTDGAAAVMGRWRGTASQLSEKISPNLAIIQCITHRQNLQSMMLQNLLQNWVISTYLLTLISWKSAGNLSKSNKMPPSVRREKKWHAAGMQIKKNTTLTLLHIKYWN